MNITRWWQIKHFFYVHPENWGNYFHFDEYFSDGLVQPPTRISFRYFRYLELTYPSTTHLDPYGWIIHPSLQVPCFTDVCPATLRGKFVVPKVSWVSRWSKLLWQWKRAPWWFREYWWWGTTQLYTVLSWTIIRILIEHQDSMESKRFFCGSFASEKWFDIQVVFPCLMPYLFQWSC